MDNLHRGGDEVNLETTDGNLKVIATADGWRCYDLRDQPTLLRSAAGRKLVDAVREQMTKEEAESICDDIPWWVMEAIDFVEANCLGWTCRAYEWGSGRSTFWLARRVGTLVSMEDDKGWHDYMLGKLRQWKLRNVDLVYRPLADGYADDILDFPDEWFDLIEVDGPQRERCIPNALDKLKYGGWLILDNSELPEYAEAIAWIDARWGRHDFPLGVYPWSHTTIWQKR